MDGVVYGAPARRMRLLCVAVGLLALAGTSTAPVAHADSKSSVESRTYAACVSATQRALGLMNVAYHVLTPAGIGNELATGERQAATVLLDARPRVGRHFASTFNSTAKRLRHLASVAQHQHSSEPWSVLHDFQQMDQRVSAICPPIVKTN